MCREEVRLNRRFAPRIYRRVVAVVRDGDGWALAPEDEPAAVEYAVEMRRVEEHRSIAALISADALERRHVLAVARRSLTNTPRRRSHRLADAASSS